MCCYHSLMTMPFLRINTVEVPVANLKRAIDWYQAALQLQCVWSDEGHALLSGSAGTEDHQNEVGTRILLVRTDDLTRLGFMNSSNGLHHSVIDFQTNDLESFHASLCTQGTHVDDLKPPVNAWAPRGFGFFDCDGNRLAVFTYANTPQSA